MCTRGNYSFKRSRIVPPCLFLVLCLAFVLHFPIKASGDKWQIMTFTDELEKDLATFNEFCFLHDLSSADVLWANNCTVDDIAPGVQIRLPVSQIDLLSLWQNRGAWQPKALVPVTSAALAERSRSGQKKQAPKSTAPTQPVQAPVASTPVPTPASKPILTPSPATLSLPTKSKVAVPVSTSVAEPVKPKSMPSTRETPAEAIAKTTTRSGSNTNDIPAVTPRTATRPAATPETSTKTNPVLILKPDGDKNTGPMRLVVVGDHVEVVRLPKEAAPKTPSLSDLNQPLGSPSILFDIMKSDGSDSLGSNNPNVNIPTGAKMMWPVSGKITSGFGPRSNRNHDGLDIPMPFGTEIRAAQEGRVLLTGTNTTPGFRGYGNFALLDHGRNICTLYAHCQDVNVQKGQYVRKGQVIATVGQTGRASTAHLHFEVRVNGKAVDPKLYLEKRQVP